MSHLNSRLTIRARLEMVQQVESGWSQAEVARQFRLLKCNSYDY